MFENIIYHAKKAEVPESFTEQLKEYLRYIKNNPDIYAALCDYYKLLFEGEDIFPIIKVQDIPLPEKSESEYPGFFSTVIFLKAAEHFKEYLIENSFDNLPYNLLDTYYKNIRRFMEMNYIRDNTYALIRHGYFLYGYAKPFSLRIGRLAFELRKFTSSVFKVYEDMGERRFLLNPQIPINDIGYPVAEGGKSDFNAGKLIENGAVTSEIKNCSQLKEIISDGECYITIHIPGEGKLDREEVIKSLKDGKEILEKVFKKYNPKLLMCTSWLISPQLKNILKAGSNILKFSELFDVVPGLPAPNALYEHIFKVPVCDVSELVPKNSFQQGILDIYKSGYELHNGIGIIKDEWNILKKPK